MILIKDRHSKKRALQVIEVLQGKYDTYKGSTLCNGIEKGSMQAARGNMILIKDRHKRCIAVFKPG